MNSDDLKVFWTEFLEEYKSYPCLWDVKAKSYKDRKLKNVAMDSLVEKCKEINPSADRDFVSRKIHSMRCAFRRELKKVKDSMSTCTRAEDVYVPKLWYFELLSFTSDIEIPRKDTGNISDVDEESGQDDFDEEDSKISLFLPSPESLLNRPSSSVSTTPSGSVMKRKRGFEDKKMKPTELAHIKTSSDTRPEDGFDITGKKFAFDLKQMSDRQRIFAEKLINDVLYYGKLGKLNENYAVTPTV